MTSPSEVRAGLQDATEAAQSDLRAVSAASEDPAEVRAALFAATPLIVSDYTAGSSALALDWYEELRESAAAQTLFTPRHLALVNDAIVGATVARTTDPLREIAEGVQRDFEEALAETMRALEGEVQKMVVDTFRGTVTENVKADPDAVGWKRHAQPDACKFCKMLAARGAVYTRETARFAAHGAEMRGGRKGGNCMCIAGPEFGGQNEWAEATPMQYLASQRTRSEKERAALRDYLTENFPDAPG